MQDNPFGLSLAEISSAEALLYGALAAAAAIMLIYYIRAEKPLITALKGMAGGGVPLALLHFFGGNIGLALPLNFFTAFVSLTLGFPGTAAMLLVSMLSGA